MAAVFAVLAGLDRWAEGLRGTLLFVPHDRAFVSALATRIVGVTEDGFRDRPCTCAGYLASAGDDHLDVDAVVLKGKSRAPAPSTYVRRDPTALLGASQGFWPRRPVSFRTFFKNVFVG